MEAHNQLIKSERERERKRESFAKLRVLKRRGKSTGDREKGSMVEWLFSS